MALDYASILSSAQNLVPDLQEQRLRGQEIDARTQQIGLQRQAMQLKLAEAQKEAQEKASAQADLHEVLLRPSPEKITAFHFKHPAYAADAKAGFDMLDKDHRTSELTQMGSIFYRAQAGDHAGAAKLLRTRIDADKAAGQDVAEDEALLAGLESDSPMERNLATGHIGVLTAAVDPDSFAKLFPAEKAGDKPAIQKEYEWRVGQYGVEAAEQWRKENDVNLVVGQPGAPVYNKADFVRGGSGQQGGGDPASIGGSGTGGSPGPSVPPIGNAKEVVQTLFPGAKVTDWKRPSGSKLGKANPKSWHVNSGAAVDVRPIPGMTFGEFVGQIKAAGHPIIEQRDEVTNPSKHATGPHWHVVIGQGGPGAKPVIARSVQEAMKLPKGTHYRNPQGREFVR